MTGPASGAIVVEREDLLALTHDVRNFKEALGKLKHVFVTERGNSYDGIIQLVYDQKNVNKWYIFFCLDTWYASKGWQYNNLIKER